MNITSFNYFFLKKGFKGLLSQNVTFCYEIMKHDHVHLNRMNHCFASPHSCFVVSYSQSFNMDTNLREIFLNIRKHWMDDIVSIGRHSHNIGKQISDKLLLLQYCSYWVIDNSGPIKVSLFVNNFILLISILVDRIYSKWFILLVFRSKSLYGGFKVVIFKISFHKTLINEIKFILYYFTTISVFFFVISLYLRQFI